MPTRSVLTVSVYRFGPNLGRAGAATNLITRLGILVARKKDVTGLVTGDSRKLPAKTAEEAHCKRSADVGPRRPAIGEQIARRWRVICDEHRVSPIGAILISD